MSKKGGHHGGAWKVAYADFVTAMMALFLVLWLVGQDQKIKEIVERAFKQPWAPITSNGTPQVITPPSKTLTNPRGGNDGGGGIRQSQAMVQLMNEVMKKLQDAFQTQADQPEEQRSVEINRVEEGVKISIFDRSRRPIFEPQSPDLTPYGEWVLNTLAWPVSSYTNFNIEVAGHTESGRPPLRENYGNWELSSDRANAARRRLIDQGVANSQISLVAGYAATQPLDGLPPEDEKNRRVTVLLKIRDTLKRR